MPTRESTTEVNLYDEGNNVLKNLDTITTQKVTRLVTVGAPIVAERNCGVHSHISNHIKHTTDR
jgi:hypothetical protein